MPERNIEFAKYGARGIKGYEAVARQLDALAGYIATPVTARRGLLARLHCLTRTPHVRAAAHAAGLTVTDRTLRAWTAGTRTPSQPGDDQPPYPASGFNSGNRPVIRLISLSHASCRGGHYAGVRGRRVVIGCPHNTR